MPTDSVREVSLREYIAQALQNAEYEKGEALDVVVAEAPDLPGCVTQGSTFEETRDNLIDAVEVWVLAGISEGEDLPIVNGCRLAITSRKERADRAPTLATAAA